MEHLLSALELFKDEVWLFDEYLTDDFTYSDLKETLKENLISIDSETH